MFDYNKFITEQIESLDADLALVGAFGGLIAIPCIWVQYFLISAYMANLVNIGYTGVLLLNDPKYVDIISTGLDWCMVLSCVLVIWAVLNFIQMTCLTIDAVWGGENV